MELNPDGLPAVNVNAAIYARDAQGDKSSLDDQIRACKSYADRMGWRIVDTLVFTDTGASGATITERPSLSRLLDSAQRGTQPFAVLLMRNSSRLGRSLIDVSRVVVILRALGISIYFVDMGLEASSECVRRLLIEHSLSNDLYLGNLSHAVRRGQKACVAKGFIHGGRRFGYDHVPVLDPARITGRRPSLLGVKLIVNPVEAAVVRRIFELRASGLSYRRIADLLNADKSSTGNNLRKWISSTVRAIVTNLIYLGRILHGRTRRSCNPETGKTVVKHLPLSGWQHVEDPDLRIISDELWCQVHGRGEKGDRAR